MSRVVSLTRWRERRESGGQDMQALERLELGKLPTGRGRAFVPMVWLALASHLGHRRRDTRVWPTNETIAAELFAPLRAVEYAIRLLRDAGKISISRGHRPRCGYGRIITMHLAGEGPNPKVFLPPPKQMRALWDRVRLERDRPAPTVALAVAAYVYGRAQHRKIGRSKACEATISKICRLAGALHRSTVQARLAVLEAVGVLGRRGATWRGGFVLFGRLARDVVQAMLDRLPAPRMAAVKISREGQARLAAMSEAFAALYA